MGSGKIAQFDTPVPVCILEFSWIKIFRWIKSCNTRIYNRNNSQFSTKIRTPKFADANISWQKESLNRFGWYELKAVVPKLFRCADHFESFGGPQRTKYWFVKGFEDHFSQSRGPQMVRGADFEHHWLNVLNYKGWTV